MENNSITTTPVEVTTENTAATSDNVTANATDVRRFKRGRHPAVTPGAFGNGRKHNGIKFRKSDLISRYV